MAPSWPDFHGVLLIVRMMVGIGVDHRLHAIAEHVSNLEHIEALARVNAVTKGF
jgi:hypothetical protein